MSSLLHLIKGEIIRLFKYKIIFFGILVSLLWLLIIGFQTAEQAKSIIPLLIVTDSGLMSIILIGASFYFEKQENTVKSLLVSPVSLVQVLIAKVISAVFTAFISLVIVVAFAIIFHGLEVQIFKLLLYILAVVISHTAIGYILILRSKDFMVMLVKYAGLMLLFYTPTLLLALEIIGHEYEIFALLSPSYAGEYLIKSTFTHLDVLKQLVAYGYLMVLGCGIYLGYVYKKFKKVAIEG
ncbi:ABC transporter permease [Acholeplasma granularum]|uniref:ABC transporter permease n=1 Tax=Acholeplasma granularum TaxID=264635 RepID=UPI0004B43783|nr:ABC transporter permease [Acholeplasma granularum]